MLQLFLANVKKTYMYIILEKESMDYWKTRSISLEVKKLESPKKCPDQLIAVNANGLSQKTEENQPKTRK